LDARLVIGKPLAEMGPRAPRLRYAVMALDSLARVGVSLPRAWFAALEEFIHSLGTSARASIQK
jgi:hypothetical protein